jgi:uncharacterized protein (TIGR02679 family)
VAGCEGRRRAAVTVPAVLADRRLEPLWRSAHARLEVTGGRLAGISARVRAPTDDQRAALDRLLGTRSRGRDIRVPLDRLDGLLRQRLGVALCDVVATTVGPLRDRPGERAAIATAEEQMWQMLVDHRALATHPNLEGWLLRLRATGSWRRLDEPSRSLTQALDVLARLPQAARRGRSRLAARTLGDSHSLDETSAPGRLVTSALAHLAGVRTPLTAAARRELWANQGVIADETSSTVLTLALRPLVVGPLTEAAGRWADGATPLPIPLAAVQAEQWEVAAGTRIWVCENPSVLAAAAGSEAMMVCVEGRPSLAGLLLLRSLAAGGGRLAYHGDFGAGGIAIANSIIGDLGAEPWRFGLEDHRAALARAEQSGTPLRPLRGEVPDACWDPALGAAIRAAGVEIEEELVLDVLLADLERGDAGNGAVRET